MGFSIKNWETDKKKEIDGTWIEYGEGVEFKLARLTNPKVRAYIEKHNKGGGGKLGRRAIQDGQIDTDLIKRAVSKFVLLDWKNITEPDPQGKEVEVPFSESKALEYLNKYDDFFEDILVIAQDINNFRNRVDADSVGNSQPSSSGTSASAK